jgi:hypothetical protein
MSGSMVILLAVEIVTIHTNPKRKRGNDLATSLTIRVGVSRNREQYSWAAPLWHKPKTPTASCGG